MQVLNVFWHDRLKFEDTRKSLVLENEKVFHSTDDYSSRSTIDRLFIHSNISLLSFDSSQQSAFNMNIQRERGSERKSVEAMSMSFIPINILLAFQYSSDEIGH